eukprot:15344316-Ditylum_brightwellii.AAC.1
MASASIRARSFCAMKKSIAREEDQFDRKMPAKKESPLFKELVKMIASEGMKKAEAQKLSRWEEAVLERHGEFLKKLSTSRKEKGRRQPVCKVCGNVYQMMQVQ